MKIFIAILVFTVVSFTARAQSPKPYFKEAKALLKENKKEEALAKINTAIELAPKNKEYLLFRADINEKLYRYRAAVKDLDDYLLIVKDDDKIMMKAGLLSLAIPDYNLADKHYGSVLELDSKNILALQNKSFSLIHLGAYQAAINALNFSMEVDKKSNYSYFLKGVAYDSLKDYTNAFTNYKKAIELAEDKEGKNLVTKNFYQEYYFNKGRANYKLKIYEEALKDFTKAATIDKEDTHVPKNTQLNYYVGLTQFAKSDFVEAINSFGKSIAANENFHAAFISRGYVYLKMGQYAISLDDFTHVILKNDTITQALIGRAECYASTGKFTEAISDLGKALKNQKGNEVLLKKIEELKAKMYEANRESELPLIELKNPKPDTKGFINVSANKVLVLIEGQIKDKSYIQDITINGKQAQFNHAQINPTFEALVSFRDVNSLEIKVKDVYNNETVITQKVAKLIDDSKGKVDYEGYLVIEETNAPLREILLAIYNSRHEKLQIVKTDAAGQFRFVNLPPDQEFILMIEEEDVKRVGDNTVLINAKSGKTLFRSKYAGGSIRFQLLPFDESTLSMITIDDAPIQFELKGKFIDSDGRTPFSNYLVHLCDKNGKIVASVRSDASGTFRFSNLNPDQSFIVMLDTNDVKFPQGKRIFLVEDGGKVVRELEAGKYGNFQFEMLSADRAMLTELSIADPWFRALNYKATTKKDFTIIENIYYDLGEYIVRGDGIKILDKAIDVLKSNPKAILEIQSHTDAQAGDDFNMSLSVKRAQNARDYIASKIAQPERVTANGFGETQLINRCANDIDCSDEEHRQNRRTVFKISVGN